MLKDCVRIGYLMHGSGDCHSLGMDLGPSETAQVKQVQVFEEPVLLVPPSRHHHRRQHRVEACRVRVSGARTRTPAVERHALSHLPRLVYFDFSDDIAELELLV